MTTSSSQSTLAHISSNESQARFQVLCEKCPRWRIEKSEHKWLDMSSCQFLGEGGHEIAVFTFDRHLRVSSLSGDSDFPIWFAAGPHWSDRWHDAQGIPYPQLPLIGIVRGLSEPTAFVEPLRVLAVISCLNAQFVYDEILRRLVKSSDIGEPPVIRIGNPRFRQLHVSLAALLNEASKVLKLPCPTIAPIAPDTDNGVSISVEDLLESAEIGQRMIDKSCDVWGSGNHVVYAYTFKAIQKAAALSSEKQYPAKIGFTTISHEWHGCRTPTEAAELRIATQIPFPEPVQLLGLLRCENGRTTEQRIHRRLANQKIKCPAREWFMTNHLEVCHVMEETAGLNCDA